MSMRFLHVVTAVLCVSLLILPAAAHTTPKMAEAKKSAGKAAGEEDTKKKKEEKSFKDAVEGFKVIEGLFTLYQKEDEGKVLLEIKPDQFDTVFLCSITREAADGYYFDSAAMLDAFPFVFKRVGKKIQFIHKNVYFRTEKDAAAKEAVSRGVSDSLIGTATTVSEPHPEKKSLLVDPSGFFVQDIGMVGHIFREFIKEVRYDFDKENSYFSLLKSFPQNTEIEVTLHFQSSDPEPVPTLPDPRSFQHTYHYSLSALPETAYKPRPADDRVGYFTTMFQDYTSVERDTAYVRYANRWHLEKADPSAEVSPPKEPVVFWIEKTVPVEYRDAVKEGVLLWSQAFERIGFKDAIVVRQQPDDADWDPADTRYNTIRWMVKPGSGYAVGPSRTSPFTGQIYDADIRISADMIREAFLGFEQFTRPVARGDGIARSLGLMADAARGHCDYAMGAARQAAFGWSLLEARSMGPLSEEDRTQYLHDFLVHIVAHEVGHTLGLRHNFKASTIRSLEQLQNRDLTTDQGLTGSVMDYLPVNIAPKGRPQGQYFQTTLGPYDYWAIEYAYKPLPTDDPKEEKEILKKIASRISDPAHAYGSDEDALWGTRAIDPSCNRYDMGADPITFHRDRIGLAKELWGKMEEKFEREGARYVKLRKVFAEGLIEYYIAVMNVPKYIAGIYHYRDHVGDSDRLPLEPVPAARQREAMEFLTQQVFSTDAFKFSPALLNKLAPERFGDFAGSLWEMERLDYPIHRMVARIQNEALDKVYDPLILSRLQDLEVKYPVGAERFTMAELFAGIRTAVWAELAGPGEVNSFRRSLQRAHVDRLIKLVVNPPNNAPEDASTLARADLVTLNGKIQGALHRGHDALTRAHLEETQARIQAALDAGIQRGIVIPGAMREGRPEPYFGDGKGSFDR